MIVPLTSVPAIVAQTTDRATLLRRIAAHDPDAAADLFYLDVKQKRFAEAVTYGRRYLAAHPKDDAFAFDLAYAYLTLGRFDEVRAAIGNRDAYLRLHPQNASIWLDLAYKAGDAKRYQQAIGEIDHYLRFRPNDAQAKQQRADDVVSLTPPAPEPSPGASEPPPNRADVEKRVAAGDIDALSDLFYLDVNDKRYDDALVYGQRYFSAHPDNDAFAIDLAYAYVSAKQLGPATALADGRAAYIQAHRESAALLAALFYGFNDAKQPDDAVKYGERYLSLRPDDDSFALDMASTQIGLGHLADARRLLAQHAAYLHQHPEAASSWLDLSYKDESAKNYRQAIADTDTYLSFRPADAAAKLQRTAYDNDVWGGPRFQTYGYNQYEGRFPDGFFGFDQTYALLPAARIQPYVATHLSEDVTSGAPGAPQIFSDDALAADVGLRTRISPNVVGFIEGGAGIGLRGQGTITDLRYGLTYSQQFSARPRPYTSVDASAAIYSRYGGNLITYYSVLHDFGGKIFRPVIGINGGLDTHSVFGNSFLEGFEGIQFGTDALSVRLLQVTGTYLTRGLPSATPTSYSTFRAMIIFGVSK